jgi:RNA polymerase sigma-70 factor (ECF subfamily)
MGWGKSRRRAPGNPRAAEFETLVRPHIPAFYKSAYRWTGTVDRAEDLVQELLVRLFPMLDQLQKLDQVRPWALRVMYRIFVDQLRRERSSPVQFGASPASADDADEDAGGPILDASEEPPTLAERQLTQERVLAAWQHLSEEHRVVLSMHDIEGYSLNDVGTMLDVPLGTMKSRLHRARARLRELLATERF